MTCVGSGVDNILDSFALDDGWPAPPPSPGYYDIRNNPPGTWKDYSGGGRIIRRYDVGGIDANGRVRTEGTIPNGDRITARGNQDSLLVNPTIPDAPGGALSLTIEQWQFMGDTSTRFVGPIARLYKASGGIYAPTGPIGLEREYNVRTYKRTSNNVQLLYNGAVIIQTVSFAALPITAWFKVKFEIVNIGGFVPGKPEMGPYDLRVYIDDVLKIEQLNHIPGPGSAWDRPLGEPQNMLYAGFYGYGINLVDQHKITIPGAGGGGPFSEDVIGPKPLPSPVPTYFMMNWNGGTSLETAYQTDVARARTGSEDRRSLAGRPIRTLTLRHTGLDQQETYELMMRLMTAGYREMPVPLFTDHSRITASSSGLTINCDTRFRRFFPNGRIVVHSWANTNGKIRPSNIEYAEIDSLTDSTITTKVALSNVHPEGARVLPVLDVELNLSGDMTGLTDAKAQLNLTVIELAGKSALLPTENAYPSEFPVTADDIPIVDFQALFGESMRWGMKREGRKVIQGRANIVAPLAARPQFSFNLPLLKLKRETVWPFVKLFDSRRGRTRVFFVISPQAAFEPIAITTTYIDVQPWGNFQDLEILITHIAIVLRDGTTYLRAEAGLTDAGSLYRITFDEVIPAIALSDIRKVSLAHLVRFEQDFMREDWTTDEVCTITLPIIELLEEKVVSLSCP